MLRILRTSGERPHTFCSSPIRSRWCINGDYTLGDKYPGCQDIAQQITMSRNIKVASSLRQSAMTRHANLMIIVELQRPSSSIVHLWYPLLLVYVSVGSNDFVSAAFLVTLSNKIGMIVNNTIEIRVNCRNGQGISAGLQRT